MSVKININKENELNKPILINRKQQYSLWEYIVRIIAIALFSLFCFAILRNDRTALSSFISVSFAFLLITIFSTIVLLRDTSWLWRFVSAYLIKVLIGVLHYLYFIDSNYFKTGIYKPLTFEFDSALNFIISSKIDKVQWGIFNFNSFGLRANHQELISIISIPFVFFGDYFLSISPINAFFSLLISMNIILISKYIFSYDKKTIRYIGLITAYFPLTLISSYLFRDIVGMALMTFGLVLVLFSKKAMIQYVMLIVAAYLFYMQRIVYPAILLFAYIFTILLSQKFKSQALDLFYKYIIFIFTIILIYYTVDFANNEVNRGYAGVVFNMNILYLPIKLLVGIIGPFPWNQFLTYTNVPAAAYQLQDYLQGTFNLSIIFILIKNNRKYIHKDQFNLLNITGILLMLSGLLGTFMHTTYVAAGVIFLVPWVFSKINLSNFRNIYFITFLVLIGLNFLVILFFGNLGIGSLWK